jgi:flagellar protein FlaF
MYQFSYAEIHEDTPKQAREREHDAIRRSIELLEAAERAGPRSAEAVEALLFVQRLWTVFIEDLSQPANELPGKLRADLISVGIWVLKEVEDIRFERSRNFRAIIEISDVIAEGLK